MSGTPGESEQDRAYEREFAAEIPPSWLTFSLGGVAMIVAALGQFGPTRKVVSWIDLPMTLLLFVFAALVAARGEQRSSGGLLGLALAGMAVAVTALGLFLRRDHPWLG